ncbi:pyridoxal phosphate-dependent decarboxylase family protein [Leptobacterium sp. I13]|uniref:pyridoxal phosphate-dependent decarboxylase family protein n=1 Tax=Leptobacterium meishanense TaxID=3128904 RepID=UPI0030ECDACD
MDSAHFAGFLKAYLENSQHLHHPKFIGHQVSAPHYAAGIADFIHGIINNPMAIYEMGPSAATIEKVLVNWMLQKVGWLKGDSLTEADSSKTQGDGVFTHGGSVANLTALLAARAKIAPDAWTEGNPSDLAVMAPEVSHYSIARTVSIMGMGSKAIAPVRVNEKEVLDPDNLYPVYQQLKAEGKRVMAVVANACATSTGLYDPITEIGLFCKENGLWFHVDGAHGAAALISEKERGLLKGAEMADSMIWDAHKMMQTSSLSTAVLFKDYKALHHTFNQKGSYLFFEKDQIGVDVISKAVECTKAALGTKLFLALAVTGEKGMAEFIEGRYAITKAFHDLIHNHPDFECPYYPESNVLCFRYTKYGLDNDFQLKIRNELVKRGNFFITSSIVNDIRYLRISVMNEGTNKEHIQELLLDIEHVAADLINRKV